MGVLQWYRQIALPFGAKACVWSFNGVARAISFLLVQLLTVVNSHFYDDLVVLEADALAERTEGCKML